MSDSSNKSIHVGNITGTGIAVGHGAQAHVTITQQSREEISTLIAQLREAINKANIPEGSKTVLLNKAVPAMDEAVTAENPKSGLEKNIERINDQLEGVGAIAENASGIVDVVAKIAKTAGIAIKTVAPFLAGLL